MSAEPSADARDEELASLHALVADLETQLARQSRRTAAILAESQEKLYWLERWQVDLDALMRKPGAVPALEALKRVRAVLRSARKLKRRLLGA